MQNEGTAIFDMNRLIDPKFLLAPLLLLAALPAAAAYNANGVALGEGEQDIKRSFPIAYCKPLEWKSRAADRRCDDAHVSFGGVEARITFYLKSGKIEAFDVRFDTRNLDQVLAFLKQNYGKPFSEAHEEVGRPGKTPRKIYKALWQDGSQQASLVSQLEKKTTALSVWRGDFQDEIYRIR